MAGDAATGLFAVKRAMGTTGDGGPPGSSAMK